MAEKFGIMKKVANKYEMPDGSKAFESVIQLNPEKYFTKDIMDKIDEACKNEFLYGKSNVTDTEESE